MESRKKYLERLKLAVEQAHNCSARYCTTIRVTEISGDRPIWDGDVEVFDLKNHPESSRCYAWAHAPGKRDERLITVLEIPPVDSAELAVKSVLASEGRSAKKSK